MQSELMILFALWLIGLVAFIVAFLPRKKLREGLIALMIFQAFIWLFDMIAIEFDLLRAPVRELPKATDMPITLNYFLYPVIFSIFYNMNRTKNNRSRFLNLFIWFTLLTLFDIVIARYTDLLEYGMPLYGMWIYIGVLFIVSQVCCDWFNKDQEIYQPERKRII